MFSRVWVIVQGCNRSIRSGQGLSTVPDCRPRACSVHVYPPITPPPPFTWLSLQRPITGHAAQKAHVSHTLSESHFLRPHRCPPPLLTLRTSLHAPRFMGLHPLNRQRNTGNSESSHAIYYPPEVSSMK